MRNLRLLLLSSAGVMGALAAQACATEAQEPGVAATVVGPASNLTSDTVTDTGTETATATTGTESSAVGNTTTLGTTGNGGGGDGGDESAASTETVTTGPVPLGGTISVTAAASTTSTTGGAVTSDAAAASAETTAETTASSSTDGGATVGGNNSGNVGGNNGFGGANGFGAAGTTSGACTATPTTTPVALTADDGWVDCSSNDIGIQGEFFTYSDGTSTITPAFTGDEICVSGTAEPTVADNSVWGAGLGVNLNQEEREADVATWDADAMGISGFRFNLSAMPTGTGLRLVYQSGGTDYCVDVTAAGAQTVLFADTAEACWGSGGDAPNPSSMEAVKWQVTTNSTSHDFSFCITQLAAVP